MRTLICGSIAYDNIMVFHGHFKDHILPNQIHILNVSFLVPKLRREYGGCAGNIAYNLKLLGGEPVIMATVGDDAGPYLRRMDELQLVRNFVRQLANTLTAQAFITTDLDDNQITAFHPGAMEFSHMNHISDWMNVNLAIVGPDGREGMLQHARELTQHEIPFVFDPGQGLPMFSGAELLEFIRQATYVTVNDYEAKMIEERTGEQIDALAEVVDALVVTRGASGSTIYTGGKRIEIPCVKAKQVVDPTGCGDAYRAGLLYGIATGRDWQTTGQLAAVMGAIKIGSAGGQNHEFTREDVEQLYRDTFGGDLWPA